MRSGAMRWVGGFSLTFGLLAALGQDACTTFGAGSEGPDASSPIQDGGPPPPPPSEASVETAPTLVIDKTAELRRGGSVVVKLTVGGARKDEGPANLEAEFSPKLDGVTFGAMNVDVAAGTGTIELKASATAKIATTELRTRVVIGRTSSATGITKVELLGVPGQLDDSFGDAGIVAETVPAWGLVVRSATLDKDGNIYVGGSLEEANFSVQPYLAKYDPAGKPIRTFGTNGLLKIPGATRAAVIGIHARPDGIVVVQVDGEDARGVVGVGSSTIKPTGEATNWFAGLNENARFAPFRETNLTMQLLRRKLPTPQWVLFPYQMDGTGFGFPGWGNAQGSLEGSGTAIDYVPAKNHDFVIGAELGQFWARRVTKTGMLDSTFGSNGEVSLQQHQGVRVFGSAALDGNIYVGGSQDPDLVLFRFDAASGAYDATFGEQHTPVDNLRTEDLPDGLLAVDDALFMVGMSRPIPGYGWSMIVAKFNRTGVLDRTFATNGIFRGRAAVPTSAHNHGLVLLDAGRHRLLVVGYHRQPDGTRDSGSRGVSLARIWR